MNPSADTFAILSAWFTLSRVEGLRTGFAFLFAAGAAVMLGALMQPMLPASGASGD
mgnify:CR=1 FL=1